MGNIPESHSLSDHSADWLNKLAESSCKHAFDYSWDQMCARDQQTHLKAWVDGYKAGPKAMRLDKDDDEALVFTGQYSMDDAGNLHRLLEELGHDSLIIIHLSEGQTIENLNQRDMAEHGWIRDPNFKA